MKIRSIRATPVNIPLRAPCRFSYGSTGSLTKTIVELLTEDGVTGLGECADGDRAADVARMGERLVGTDIRDILPARRACVPGKAYTPWGNVAGQRRVFAAIETAMWDARGKTEGLPLHRLLGGAVRDRIALTEYFSYRLPGAAEPGEASPADIARYCARMIEAFDAQAFEGKVGTVGLAEELRMVAAVRDAIGDRPLQLDANGIWTLPTARDALRRLMRFDIAWFEEPCETYAEMAALRRHFDCAFSSHVVDLLPPSGSAARCDHDQRQRAGRHPRHGRLRRRLRRDGGRVPVPFGRDRGRQRGLPAAFGGARARARGEPDAPAVVCRRRDRRRSLRAACGGRRRAGGAGAWRHARPRGAAALRRCHDRYLAEGSFPAAAAAAPGAAYGSSFRKR